MDETKITLCPPENAQGYEPQKEFPQLWRSQWFMTYEEVINDAVFGARNIMRLGKK